MAENNTYNRYLANKHGSGVGANLTEQGGHKVVEGIMNAYSASGQKIPLNMQNRIEELRDIARSEYEMRNASAGARHTLSLGGSYDALATGRRERELVNGLLDASRGVVTEPDRIAMQQARDVAAGVASDTRVKLGTEKDRIAQVKQGTRSNEQTLRTGELQYNTAKLQLEMAQTSEKSATAIAKRAEAAQAVTDSLGDTSTLDIMEAVNADNPQIAAELFGPGVTRDVQLEILTQRLVRENAVMQAGGQPMATNGQADAQDAQLGMVALEMRRSAHIIKDHGEDLPAIVTGELPLPEGMDRETAQKARQMQIQKQTDQNQLTVDLINDRLDVDGVAPGNAGGKKEDKVETGYRIMSTLSMEEIGAMQEDIAAGNPVTLQIPGMEETLTLTSPQAVTAFQLLDSRMTASAQAQAMQSTKQQAVQTFADNLTTMESRIKTARLGVIPRAVQEVIAQERVKLTDIAFNDGDISKYVSSVNAIEKVMIAEGMTEDQVGLILTGRFQNDAQVANGAINMLGRDADEHLFTPAMNGFLAQVAAKSADTGLIGSSPDNPLTPDRLAELRGIWSNEELSAEESAAQTQKILGYPVGELRTMMQSSLIAANFNQGFSTFMAKAAEEGYMDTGTAEQLMTNVQKAVRERMNGGQSLTADDYINTVSTLADVYVTDPAQRGALMGVFFDSLRETDGSTLFHRADGSTSQDELALFAIINSMTDVNTPLSGLGSIPADEIALVLGQQLEDQVDRSVLGHQRFTNNSQQQQIIAGTISALMGADLFDPSAPLRPRDGADPADVARYNEANTKGNRGIIDFNPGLSQLVTGMVLDDLLSHKDRPKKWADFLLPEFAENALDAKGHYEAVNMEAIRKAAQDAGYIKGN